MSPTSDRVVQELESALLERARRLADEYLERARRARQHILEDAQEKLHLREEQATTQAQAEADRYYRRQVQASELEFTRRLDRLRWELIQETLEQVKQRLAAHAATPAYERTLAQLLRRGADSIERNRLVAAFNEADLARLQPRWEEFLASVGSDREIRLQERPLPSSGGVLVRSEDDRIRVDNTFEGRLERLQPQVLQVITERLFAAEVSQRGLLHE